MTAHVGEELRKPELKHLNASYEPTETGEDSSAPKGGLMPLMEYHLPELCEKLPNSQRLPESPEGAWETEGGTSSQHGGTPISKQVSKHL